MNRHVCRYLAVAVLVSCATPAQAVVIVAEDFLYNEPTKAVFNLAGFTQQDYGGGQNGGGVWDSRWVSVGGTTIVGADAATPPLSDNPHTAVVTEVASAASLQRSYALTAAATTASTIYFAADFKVDNVATPNIFAEVGILSPAATLDVPSVSLGVTDSEAAIPGAFFAKIGASVVVADPAANVNNALTSGAWVRIVGKLELNALPAVGDYDRSGRTDGGDFLVWQRQFGTNVTPSSGADGDGNGVVNGADLTLWKGAYGQTGAERLTVYFNPTGVEQTAATVLTGTASLLSGINDAALARVVSLNGDPAPRDSDRPHFIDNVAVGTTWADVAAVNVPRLTLEVNTGNGQTRLINNSSQAVPLAYYEILSPSGSLSRTAWSSLDDQNVSGGAWVENNPQDTQLIESNFTGSTTIAAGGEISLGAAFSSGGTQDLVARWGTKEGSEGLLNLAPVVYVNAAVAAAVPEPTCGALLAAALGVLASGRRHRPGGWGRSSRRC